MATFQPRQLSEAEKARLKDAEDRVKKAQAEVEKAQAEVEFWSDEVKKAVVGSEERKEAKEREAFFVAERDKAKEERDKAKADLRELEVRFGQVQEQMISAAPAQKDLLKMDAEEVLRAEINGLDWPTDLEAFNPRALITENFRNREAAVRVAQAGILGNFRRPTEPDLLLTELARKRESTEFTLHEFDYDIDSSDNLDLRNPEPITLEDLDKFAMTVLIGTSGAGKTALTLHRALERPTILLVCTQQATGGMGSFEVSTVLSAATSMHESGKPVDEVSAFVKERMRKILYSRAILYTECKRRYPGFTNLHWIMLQLYGDSIFGRHRWCPDFVQHPSLSPNPAEALADAGIQAIVLDEAQVADNVLTATFPSLKNGAKRSILSPIARTLAESSLKVIICGTGLSSASVVPTAVSPIKFDVRESTRVGVVAVATFLDTDQVKGCLEEWGVSDLHRLDRNALEFFQGRPRHAAYLARDLILSESASLSTPQSAEDGAAAVVRKLTEQFRKVYLENLKKTRGMSVERLGKTTSSAKDLYYRIKSAAARYRLGYPGILEIGFQTAIQHGVCALRELEEAESEYGSKSSSHESGAKRVRLARPVVAEPLLLNAFSEDVLDTFENEYIDARSHSEVGFIFEDILAAKHTTSLSEAVRRAARTPAFQAPPVRPDDKGKYSAYDREWKFNDVRSGARLVERSSVKGIESRILRAALENKQSKVIMPCQAMGPDLIIVSWDDKDTPLVILVQSKSSMQASTPEAVRSLEQLFVEKRAPTPPKDETEAAKAFETVLAEYKCLVALIVVKPFEGSRQANVSLNAKGRLVVILDKRSLDLLAPELSTGITAMSNAKMSS